MYSRICENYRPISLNKIFSKGFETCFTTKLMLKQFIDP